MPGSFGTTNNDDGAIASTSSSDKSGIFARNDATNPAPTVHQEVMVYLVFPQFPTRNFEYQN